MVQGFKIVLYMTHAYTKILFHIYMIFILSSFVRVITQFCNQTIVQKTLFILKEMDFSGDTSWNVLMINELQKKNLTK
jgi:hypothetical protein